MFKKKTDKTSDGAAKNKKQSADRVKKSTSPEKNKRSQSTSRTKNRSKEDDTDGLVTVLGDGGEVGHDDEPANGLTIEERIERTKQQIELEQLSKEARMRDRLQYLEAMKLQRDEVTKRWPGKSLEVGLRLDWFADLKKFLLEDEAGDECKVLSTIDAIVEAYKSGDLEWVPGYVTYWSYGKQLTELREFDWEEFLCWNTKYKGGEGFWVEGLRDSTPTRRYWKRTIAWPGRWDPPKGSGIDPDTALLAREYSARVKLPILFRILRRPSDYDPELDPHSTVDPMRPKRHRPPGWYDHPVPRETLPPNGSSRLAIDGLVQMRRGYASQITRSPRKPYDARFIWMEDDTGCDICTLMKSDIDDIIGAAQETLTGEGFTPPENVFPPPLLGYVAFQDVRGVKNFQPIRALEINMMGEENRLHLKNEWDFIEVAVAKNQTHPLPPIRLLGPWLRHRFFTATCPDSTGRMWVFNKGNRLRVALPVMKTHMWFTGDLPVHTLMTEEELPEGAAQQVEEALADPVRTSAESPLVVPGPAARPSSS